MIADDLQPTTVVKSLVPRANSLLFFEVSDKSFHQVSEMLSANKTRYSINGWFHGKANNRPDKLIEMVPEPMPYLNIDVIVFYWNIFVFVHTKKAGTQLFLYAI